jgi:septal ring factor EnvC (AmiA/AmiB activator)
MLKLSQSEQESVRKEISRVSELLHSAEEGLSKREKEVEAALHEQSVLSAQVSNLGEKLSASNHIIASLDN